MDYYSILDLKRDCTDSQIKNAYKLAAMKWHPQKNAGQKREMSENKFREISEAYEVLSDPQRRAKFDQYGEAGLKQGVPNGKGGVVPGWSFTKNPEAVFAEFFGSSSPFAEYGADASLSIATPAPAEKQLPLEQNLYCSLEELYVGASKKVKVARRRLNADAKTSRTEDAVLTVDVKAGWKAGTKITFKGDGHEGVGLVPSDLVFTLREKPHPRFVRRGDDLVYRAPVTLLQALTGVTVEVLTLDGRTLPIAVNNIVQPGYSQAVAGEGMPNPKAAAQAQAAAANGAAAAANGAAPAPAADGAKARGDLIIEFDIAFPKALSIAQKTQLTKALGK